MTDTTIAAGALIVDAQPYIVALASVAISAASAVAVALLKKYTGIALAQALTDKVDAYLADLAAKEVAAAADNLATAKINVGSEMVQDLTTKALRDLPGELGKLGLAPSDVASKLTAEFGRLQASMTAVPVPTPGPAKS